MQIRILSDTFALVRLPPAAPAPGWIGGRELIAIVRTRDELSIVCSEAAVPPDVLEVERGFRAVGVVGTLDFGVTNVVASLTAPLAAAGIPIFTISTFDTVYILMREDRLADAAAALRSSGHSLT